MFRVKLSSSLKLNKHSYYYNNSKENHVSITESCGCKIQCVGHKGINSKKLQVPGGTPIYKLYGYVPHFSWYGFRALLV